MPEELNIESSVADIASDLGLGAGESDPGDPPDDDSALTTATESDTDSDAPISDDQGEPDTANAPVDAAPITRAPPKAWAKEKHEVWSKLDPSAQEYIETREKQMLEGLSQYSEAAKFGRTINEAIAPYQEILKTTGADAPTAIRALFEAHKQLSNPDPAARAAYFAKMASHYGIDAAKAGQPASDEPPSVRELRERTERLERERAAELTEKQRETQERIRSEVTSFADAKDEQGNLKHPYFDECAEDIVAYVNAGHTLDKAYEKAVYANPVTRAKEIARQREADAVALRAKAKQEAEKARNASRTNVNSRDTRRVPTASKVGNWEEGMTATLQEIKARTH